MGLSHDASWWDGGINACIILEVILCTDYVELVLKSSIEKRVGRTLSRIGKSAFPSLVPEGRR